jgi:hypothetical protein
MKWPHGDPNAIAKEILAQSAYRVAPTQTKQPPLTLWELFWQWVDRLLRPFFDWLSHAAGSSGNAGTLIGIAIIIIAVSALALLLYRIVAAFVRPSEQRGVRVAAGGRLELRSAVEWRALAAQAAAAGDYARAIAALFAAALVALDERALVPFDAACTPGEYRRRVRRAREGAAAPFDRLVERFVLATFAPELPQRADYDAALHAFASFEPLVSSP